MRYPRIFSVLCLLLSLSSSASAGPPAPAARPSSPPASPASTTTKAATDRARTLHIEGAKLYDEGKYDQAYVAFVAAWALKQHPAIAGNLADCEVKLGKYRDAAEHYQFVVRNASGEAKDEDVRRAEERLGEVKKEIVTLTIQGPAANTEIFIDDKLVGQTPLDHEVFVEAGDRTLVARHATEGSEMQRVRGTKGTAKRVQLVIGLHAQPEDVAELRRWTAKQEAESTRKKGILIAGAATTGAVLVAGVVFTVVANGHRADSRSFQKEIDATGMGCVHGANASTCAKLDDALAKTDTFRNLGLAGFISAGVVGAATVTYLLWPAPKVDGRKAVRVAPLVGASGAALLVQGSF